MHRLFTLTPPLALILALGASLAVGCEWIVDSQDYQREEVPIFRSEAVSAPAEVAPDALRVVAWNIKYGAKRIPFWFDCWGDRVRMSLEEVEGNMADIYGLIDELDPDILMTEEIEVNSRRSAYLDMVQGILDNTALDYAAYFESWDSRYIASEGLGRMNLGNAIFSRYPIALAERIRQIDRSDQDALTKAFYLKRTVGRVEIQLGGADARVAALVVHTEAYDVDGTKQKQIEHIHELVSDETLDWVLGGDFNELPPNATRLEGFPDERSDGVCGEDFVQPPYTPEAMAPLFADFAPWIGLGRFDAEPVAHFTHTVLGPDQRGEDGEPGDWSRTLDYLFAHSGATWRNGASQVVQHRGDTIRARSGELETLTSDVLRLSDHAPVVGTWELR